MTMTHDHLHAQSNDEVATLKARIAELERMDTEHTVQIAKMNAYIRELEEAQRWRKCSEELPTDDSWCIVYHEDSIDVDHYYKGNWVMYDDYVTHWLPLPDKPEV